jgi:hypothetical protein
MLTFQPSFLRFCDTPRASLSPPLAKPLHHIIAILDTLLSRGSNIPVVLRKHAFVQFQRARRISLKFGYNRNLCRTRDSATAVGTGYQLDERRCRKSSMRNVKTFLHIPQIDTGTQPDTYLMCKESLFPGVRRPGRGAGHLVPKSTEFNRMWQCGELHISLAPYGLQSAIKIYRLSDMALVSEF